MDPFAAFVPNAEETTASIYYGEVRVLGGGRRRRMIGLPWGGLRRLMCHFHTRRPQRRPPL
jgi:hypothetical protein